MFWRVLTTVVLLSPLASASSFNTQHLRVSAMNGIGLGAQGVPDADEVSTTSSHDVWLHAPNVMLSPCSGMHQGRKRDHLTAACGVWFHSCKRWRTSRRPTWAHKATRWRLSPPVASSNPPSPTPREVHAPPPPLPPLPSGLGRPGSPMSRNLRLTKGLGEEAR